MKVRLPAVLLLIFMFSGAASAEKNTPAPDVDSALERRIKEDLIVEFGTTRPAAYILRGTLLYLYHPRRSKHLNINSLGFRGGEVRPKAKDEFRIAVLGGSTVFGVRQADFQTVPFLLEKLLRKKHRGGHIVVYNLGIEGYTIERETALMERLAPEVRPDLVVYCHGWNDMSMAYHINYRDLEPFNEEDETFFARRQEEVPVQHAITGAAGRIWKRISGREWWNQSEPDYKRRESLFYNGYTKHLRNAQEYFRKESVPVIFVIQPSLATRKNKTDWEREYADSINRDYPGNLDFINRCIARLRDSEAFREGILFDISDAFDKYDGAIYRDPIHVNEAGNRIVAERLAAIIEAGGYIPVTPGGR